MIGALFEVDMWRVGCNCLQEDGFGYITLGDLNKVQ